MNVRDINTAPSRQAQATCKKRRSRGAAVYASGPLEAGDRLLAMREVECITSAKKSWIYERIGRGLFPRPIRLCASRRVAWSERAIQAWIAAQGTPPGLPPEGPLPANGTQATAKVLPMPVATATPGNQ